MIPAWARFSLKESTFGIPELPGVYIFIQGADPLYVGGTNNLFRRLSNHEMKRKLTGREYISILWEPVYLSEVAEIENFWIGELKTPHNKTRSYGRNSWGNEFFFTAREIRRSNKEIDSFRALRKMMEASK